MSTIVRKMVYWSFTIYVFQTQMLCHSFRSTLNPQNYSSIPKGKFHLKSSHVTEITYEAEEENFVLCLLLPFIYLLILNTNNNTLKTNKTVMGHVKLQTSIQAIIMLCKIWGITKQSNLTDPGCCWYVMRGPQINKSKNYK